MNSQTPFSSSQYWQERYEKGGNSGAGSAGRLASFKAETLNAFVKANHITSVIELGSGDGSQLQLATYPRYTGLDVSDKALELCRTKFACDSAKEFLNYDSSAGKAIKADMAMSIDVLFHLTEEQVYQDYMMRLINAGQRFIAIYSSDFDGQGQSIHPHIYHHKFTNWMTNNAKSWHLQATVPNPFPWSPENSRDLTTSWSDFYFFRHE